MAYPASNAGLHGNMQPFFYAQSSINLLVAGDVSVRIALKSPASGGTRQGEGLESEGQYSLASMTVMTLVVLVLSLIHI